MYDFIMNLNIFVILALVAGMALIMTYFLAFAETVVLKVAGKDKEPFGQSVMKHFDEITS